MEKDKTPFRLLRKIVLTPLILFITGGILSLLFLIDVYYLKNFFSTLFATTSHLGYIIIALSFILFAYNILAFICEKYKNKYLGQGYEVAYLMVSIIHKELRVIFILFALYTAISLEMGNSMAPSRSMVCSDRPGSSRAITAATSASQCGGCSGSRLPSRMDSRIASACLLLGSRAGL